MIFKAPWFFLLLPLLPLLYRVLKRSQLKTQKALQELKSSSSQSKPGNFRIMLKISGVLMLILALARPAWNPHPVPSAVKGRDLVIALDISRSMLAADVYPSRLEAARFVLLEALPGFRGQRLGLLTFAGSSSVRVPLTLDHNFLKYILDRVQPADADIGSTSLQSAVEKALDIVLDESEKGKQDLIILTDGEDHISDVDKVVEQLREWGARVLIIGMGDPVTGARVPDIGDEKKWMKYKGQDVISRLDETILQKLASESPGIVYYPARTKAFDLMTLYRNLLEQTSEMDAGDQTQVVYDEGFQYCVALALLLLAFSFKHRLWTTLLVLAICGCGAQSERGATEYERHFNQGLTSWQDAQLTIENNPAFAMDILMDVRESFLQAAMFKPGDLPAAQHIAGVSAQMREVERKVKELQKEEEQLQQILEQSITRLQELTVRENKLSRNAQQLLRRRPPASREEKRSEADRSTSEQDAVSSGTVEVLDNVRLLQSKVREMLGEAFGDEKHPAETEYDVAVQLLTAAGKSQRSASSQLSQNDPNWIKAGNSFLVAVRKMQETLDLLSDQNGDDSRNQDSDQGEMDDWDFEEDMEWSESTDPAALSMPIRSRNFNSALNNRNMPIPNYTAEEILAEEEANSLKRSRQNESRAGAKVEKNW